MRIGFIGVGGIAGNYLSSLKRLNQPVAAVCDVNAERAAQVAGEHQAASYGDHREMLAQEKLDAVFIGIPPGAHEGQVADAAGWGAAVFVAKPIGLDLDAVRRTRDVIQAKGVINQVGYMARYSDITEKAREITKDQPLGMGIGRFMCRMGAHPWWGKQAMCGGQMLEQSTHVFDLLRYFLGEVAEVQAYGHKGLGDDIADFEDSTVCNLRFANGAVGNVTSTCIANAPDGFAMELTGRDFYLRFVMDTRLQGQINGEALNFEGQEAGYFRQVEQFLKAVEQHDQSLVRSSYADAARTLAVTLAANRSLETGQLEKVVEV
ncbi:MAG: Gfo/Idh/MocA family oxidoreductase [Abitibacteriaceae bacterium]|nr:Gfo/Idh/MocA family oxidoreductase [Abditibacteriaceae bacterium]